jgi:hypothetical protein
MNDIIAERSGNILRIQLNRPDKKNAMTSSMYITMAEFLEDAAKDDARRRDSLRTVFGGFLYCPFTVHFVPKTGYIRWNGLEQAKRLTARVDSKHAGLALTV